MNMSRPANIQPSVPLNLKLPADLKQLLDARLFDRSLGRVPVGAYQRFFIPLIRDELAELEKLDYLRSS